MLASEIRKGGDRMLQDLEDLLYQEDEAAVSER